MTVNEGHPASGWLLGLRTTVWPIFFHRFTATALCPFLPFSLCLSLKCCSISCAYLFVYFFFILRSVYNLLPFSSVTHLFALPASVIVFSVSLLVLSLIFFSYFVLRFRGNYLTFRSYLDVSFLESLGRLQRRQSPVDLLLPFFGFKRQKIMAKKYFAFSHVQVHSPIIYSTYVITFISAKNTHDRAIFF